MYWKCRKINPHCDGLYIDSPHWIKGKEAAISPISKNDNKFFQFAVAVALNHEEIKKESQRIRKSQPFINEYNWKEMNYLSGKDDW